jgi:hypothetical protein
MADIRIGHRVETHRAVSGMNMKTQEQVSQIVDNVLVLYAHYPREIEFTDQSTAKIHVKNC